MASDCSGEKQTNKKKNEIYSDREERMNLCIISTLADFGMISLLGRYRLAIHFRPISPTIANENTGNYSDQLLVELLIGFGFTAGFLKTNLNFPIN